MISEIRLQYYRQHENRTVTFGRGINAIRAPNGTGKTKLLEAISYCLFGARALAEPLDDVVTRGVAVSKLKAETDISHLGVDYTFARSKAGAEVRAGGKVLVTGQTEVTKFAESLFGANAEMASKLMIAKQKQLGGALSGGAAKASEMIEFLADFDLFDRIVTLIQEKLPSGVTTGTEARIKLLHDQLAGDGTVDTLPLVEANDAAQARLGFQRDAVSTLTSALEELKVGEALTTIAQFDSFTSQQAATEQSIAGLKAALEMPLPEAPDETTLADLRARIAAQKELASALALKAELVRADTGMLWDEPLVALHAAIGVADYVLASAVTETATAETQLRGAERLVQTFKSDVRLEIAQLRGRLILEESCAFCGKDLKDIPEVALNNNPLVAQIKALEAKVAPTTEKEAARLAAAQRAEQEARQTLAALKGVDATNAKVEQLYGRAERFITVDRSVVPGQWTWTGPVSQPEDFSAQLAQLEAQQRAAQQAEGQRTQQQAQLAQQEKVLAGTHGMLRALPIGHARLCVQASGELKEKLVVARAALESAADAASLAAAALKTAQVTNEQVEKAKAETQAQLKQAEEELGEVQANNALIKKVRTAKPQVIDQLWSMALAATSRYGSQMRGEAWSVTRSDGEFKVNGFPAAGLSGAEEDLLGLAIRVALTKLFLPSTGFMILDEVAAACDDQRETSMLGLLATLDFDQIILVTHSELCESFASQIITF